MFIKQPDAILFSRAKRDNKETEEGCVSKKISQRGRESHIHMNNPWLMLLLLLQGYYLRL